MIKNNYSDTFINGSLSSLINSYRNGERAVEPQLVRAISPIVENVARKWENLLLPLNDRIQECLIFIFEALKRNRRDIANPVGYIREVSKNCLRNLYEKEKAEKRTPPNKNRAEVSPEKLFMDRGGSEDSIEARIENARVKGRQAPPEGESIWGQTGTGPDENEIQNGECSMNEIIMQFMERLPKNLKEGIERSLELIADLFRTRDKLRRASTRSRKIIKVIEEIKKARLYAGRVGKLAPKAEDFITFLFHGDHAPEKMITPEGERENPVWRAEMDNLFNKYGKKNFSASLFLFQAERELAADILTPSRNYATLGKHFEGALGGEYSWLWIDYLPEILKMKISPPSLIFKVWSQAPVFLKGGSGKYKNRQGIEFAIYGYKLVTKGTDKEFLFSSIREDSFSRITEIRNNFDRFRKAGYGPALQKKYKPIINLIYQSSFPQKEDTSPHSN